MRLKTLLDKSKNNLFKEPTIFAYIPLYINQFAIKIALHSKIPTGLICVNVYRPKNKFQDTNTFLVSSRI